MSFHCLKQANRKDVVLVMECRDRMRGSDFHLKEGRFGLDISNKFVTGYLVNYSNRFPRKIVDAFSLGMFKGKLNDQFEKPGLVEGVLTHSRGVGLNGL